jgi:hypothetical protein
MYKLSSSQILAKIKKKLKKNPEKKKLDELPYVKKLNALLLIIKLI